MCFFGKGPKIEATKTPADSTIKKIFLFIGPLAALAVGVSVNYALESSVMGWTAGVTMLCAIWWMVESISIPATSLIPLAIFPLTGVLSVKEVSEAYGDNAILLMLGGFILSAGMESSGTHRRIALGMVNLCGGGSAKRLVFGFMLASAVLSMWISNAATALMLLPVAMAVTSQTDSHRLRIALLIGIAYAASIGGIGTPIGTPPNLMFLKVYREETGLEVGFFTWMSWVFPILLIMLPIAGFWLTRGLAKIQPVKLPSAGAWRRDEVLTLTVFVLTATFWMTRTQPMGGWSSLLGIPEAKDSSIAILGAIALFVLPNQQGGRLLKWEAAQKIPWGILILFAGGICIARAFKVSGLSQHLGEVLGSAGGLPVILLIGAICLGVTFLTEVTSNTATTTLLLPILAAGALTASLDPKLIMIPATISASFAFMLPVATPPNAIMFSSGQFSVKEMAREGIVLNLIGVVIVSLICYWNFGQ